MYKINKTRKTRKIPLFDDKSNKLIRHHMKIWGHLDDCFVRISELIPDSTPEQISNHWRNYLDPGCKYQFAWNVDFEA